jgi:hypothetical protein
MKQVDIEKYNEEFDQKLEKLGYDPYKVDRMCDKAAHIVSPLFHLYGISYGDRVPDVYYIAFTLKELVVSIIEEPSDTGVITVATGRFMAVKHTYEDEPPQITLTFELADEPDTELAAA